MTHDPCFCNISGFCQSPIVLNNDDYNILNSSSTLRVKKQIVEYVYKPEPKNFDVLNSVTLDNNGLEYELIEFHFHQPGEHTVNHKREPLEIHFVFEADNSIFVVGYLVRLSCKTSPLISNIIDRREFYLPKLESYFTYPGSLSPLNVNWNVSTQTFTISLKDLIRLKPFCKSDRSLQDRNGRDIVLVEN